MIVSFEGISGVGKTYMVNRVIAALHAEAPLVVAEVSNRDRAGLDRMILQILASSADPFFRGGHPMTETLLLMALKTLDYEDRIRAVSAGLIALEDRSVDSVAVYQSIICAPDACDDDLCARALTLLGSVNAWRPSPDLTFLITDDFETAIARAEQRNGRAYRDDERVLLRRAAMLYNMYAATIPRIVTVDRRVHADERTLVAFIVAEIRQRLAF